MDFILANIELIITLIAALVGMVYAIVTKQWTLLQVAAYKLMLSVERLAKTKEGSEKMDEVFSKLWVTIPSIVKKFVSEDTVKNKLQIWYDLAKDSIKHEENSAE